MSTSEAITSVGVLADTVAKNGVPVDFQFSITWQTGLILGVIVFGGIVAALYLPRPSR